MNAREHSFTFARDIIKQVIALSTAIPALMITVSKDFVSNLPENVKSLAFWSWGFFLASVFFGIISLMTMTGILGNIAKDENKEANNISTIKGIYSSNLRLWAGLQMLMFFIGLALVICFGWNAVP